VETKHKIGLGIVATGLVAGLVGLLVPTKSKYRNKIISIIEDERAKPDVAKYWRTILKNPNPPYPKHWCGALALFGIKKAGLAKDVNWEIGKGFLLPNKLKRITAAELEVGDIAYFNKNQHHAVVKSVNDDGTITTLDGNDVGGSIGEHIRNPAKVTAFYSIDKFLEEVL
jgi:hypothetical protein